ncbi:VENN motif pre-toxin domain-containing protein [Cupriavidus sp. CP313]
MTVVASYSGGKSVPASDPNLGPVQPAHVDWAGNTNLLQSGASSLAATAAGNAQKSIDGSAAGVTKSAIAPGTVTITDSAGQQANTGKSADETVAALNRDTASANQNIDKIFDAQKVKDQRELNQLKSQVAQQLAPMVYQQVGDVLVGAAPETKAAVHALVGGLLSEALGGSFAAGAAGGAAASLAMEAFGQALLDQKDLSDSDRKALVQLAGAIVGGAAGAAAGGSLSDAAAGVTVGKVATESNYLNHIQKRDRAEALAACKDEACRKQVQAEYAAEWEKNRASVENCSSQSECLSIAQSLRTEQQEQGQRIAELQAKGPINWTDAEKLEYADLRLGDTSLNQMRSIALGNAAKLTGGNVLSKQETANLLADVGIGAASGFGGAIGPKGLTYEAAPYHGSTDNSVKSRGPTNGQTALENSVQVKDTSPRRVSVDPETGDFVVFDRTLGDVYHGHVRPWSDLTTDMQNALVRAGYVDRKGNLK